MAATISNSALNQHSTAVSGGTTPSDLFIRDVPDWTRKLRRTDTPVLKLIGGLKSSGPSTPMNKAEWGWGSPDPVKDLINGALSDTTGTTVTVDNGTYFQVGNVVRVDDEQMHVTAISTNTLTVTRGFAGSTAATHADNAPVYIIGVAMKENQDDQSSPITQGELDYNYHQIQSWMWQLSQRAKVTPTYESRNFSGTRDQQELRKKMEDTAPLFLERTILDGLRSLGTSAVPSTMGGFQQTSFFTTQTSVTGALEELDLMNAFQTVYDLVGEDKMAKLVICGSKAKRIVSSWYNDNRRYTGTDEVAKVHFDEIDTDWGRIKFVVDYQLDALGRSDEMFSIKPEDFTLRPYASSTGWTTGKLATNGWYDKGFLRVDCTLIAQNPDSRFHLYGFSTTDSDYPSLS